MNALKVARLRKGLTQAQLGNLLGMDAAHISRIENGRLTPGLNTFQELVRALDLELMLVPKNKVRMVRSLIAEPDTAGADRRKDSRASAESNEPGSDEGRSDRAGLSTGKRRYPLPNGDSDE